MTETNNGGSALTAASWWTVDRSHEPRLTEGATPLVESCIRTYGWTEEFTLRVLEGYKQFLSFKQVFEDWNATKLSSPLPVDQMWHQHILDTKNYANDCELLVGRFVHHDRDGGLDVEARRERVESTQNAIRTLHGDTYDRQVWDFGLDVGDDAGRGSNRRPRENEPDAVSRAVRARSSAQEMTRTVSPTDQSNGSDSLSFRINTLSEGTVQFRTTMTSPFSTFFRAYACLQRVDVNQIRFMFRSFPITCDDTPAQVNLRDGDTIVAFPLVDGQVSFSIWHSNGEKAFVTTGRAAPLGPHLESIASEYGVHWSELRFQLDGERVYGDQTPEMIGLETGDIIDVSHAQTGC